MKTELVKLPDGRLDVSPQQDFIGGTAPTVWAALWDSCLSAGAAHLESPGPGHCTEGEDRGGAGEM